MGPTRFLQRVKNKYRRTASRWLFRRPFTINTSTPVISFTFDDFPRSALWTGGAILQSFGLAGTYFTSFGLMGKQAPTGTMFLNEDVQALLKQGHELGCHTFGHCHSGDTSPQAFEDAVIQNRQALSSLVPGASFHSFSYPISDPRPQNKQRVSKYFACCRCGGQTFNAGRADLNYLSAFFLEQSRDYPEAIRNLIDQNREARGWLIFATHDICETPTPWGCTPELFAGIVKYAVDSGARILPVFQAWEALRASSPS